MWCLLLGFAFCLLLLQDGSLVLSQKSTSTVGRAGRAATSAPRTTAQAPTGQTTGAGASVPPNGQPRPNAPQQKVLGMATLQTVPEVVISINGNNSTAGAGRGAAPKAEPEKSEASYFPQGGVGLRSNQHFFPPGKELIFIDGTSHLEESYDRRISTLRQLHEAEHTYSEESMPKEIEDAFCFRDRGKFDIPGAEDRTVDSGLYLWHQYYQTQWDSFDFGSKGVAIAQTTNESKDL